MEGGGKPLGGGGVGGRGFWSRVFARTFVSLAAKATRRNLSKLRGKKWFYFEASFFLSVHAIIFLRIIFLQFSFFIRL